jgi:hypothetical protein
MVAEESCGTSMNGMSDWINPWTTSERKLRYSEKYIVGRRVIAWPPRVKVVLFQPCTWKIDHFFVSSEHLKTDDILLGS